MSHERHSSREGGNFSSHARGMRTLATGLIEVGAVGMSVLSLFSGNLFEAAAFGGVGYLADRARKGGKNK